jgi:hypothetical protein
MLDLTEGVRDIFLDAQQYTYDHVTKAWSDLVFKLAARRAELSRNYRATHRGASREWSRKWRAENPEACLLAKQKYQQKHRAQLRVKLASWRAANPELVKAQRERENEIRRARRAA